MKRTVYIETSVVSYYTSRPSRDLLIAARQEATHELWPRLTREYEPYVSALVLEEAGRGDPEQGRLRLEAVKPFMVLDLTDEVLALAERIIAAGGIPAEYPEDSSHVAVSAVNGIEALVTWNFAHLNNPFTRMMVRQAVEDAGYRCPEITSPDALLEAAQ